jgi:hypothetical protein
MATMSYVGYFATVACCLKNGRKVAKLARNWLALAQYGSKTCGGNGGRHLHDLLNSVLTSVAPVAWMVIEANFMTSKSAILLVGHTSAILNC